MNYQMNKFLFAMILTELEDAVGKENCSTRQIDKVTHSVDYYWLSRMWADRGERMPEADFVVCPKDATIRFPLPPGAQAAALRAAQSLCAAVLFWIPSG